VDLFSVDLFSEHRFGVYHLSLVKFRAFLAEVDSSICKSMSTVHRAQRTREESPSVTHTNARARNRSRSASYCCGAYAATRAIMQSATTDM